MAIKALNMAKEAFTFVKLLTVSSLAKPEDHATVLSNLFKVSSRGTLLSGIAALVSSTFSKYLAQEGFSKALAPHIFKASSTSSLTFTAIAACCFYKLLTTDDKDLNAISKNFNEKVSLFGKGSALVGWVGAAAAWASKYVTSNAHVSSLATRSLSPLLALGAAGSILWLFLHSQNQQRVTMSKIT
jgi:hypothetical protein